MIPTDRLKEIQWVIFDAVGTLMTPEPSVAQTYQEVASRYGSRLSIEEIRVRFKSAFHRVMSTEGRGLATSEVEEACGWQKLVNEVLDDVNDHTACFKTLWVHFGQPGSWKLIKGCDELLSSLRSMGLQLGIGSNFDSRLRTVIDGKPELADIKQMWISSEVGWKKPAEAFYRTIIRDTQVLPNEILFIGDDDLNDVISPRQLGMQSMHIDELK